MFRRQNFLHRRARAAMKTERDSVIAGDSGQGLGRSRSTPLTAALGAAVFAALLAGCGASFNNETTTAVAAPDMAGAVSGPVTHAAAASATTTVAAAPADKSQAPSALAAADALTAAARPGSAAYKVGPLDQLEVSVFKVPELSKTVQVADTGTINLPLVGEVPAAGKTAQEIERDLTAKLGAKYLQNPQVTVFVKEYNSQRVTVEGAVKKPGVYPVKGNNTLLQFIATAEGLDSSSDSSVVVFRQTNGKRTAARFDLGEIRSGNAEDPTIVSGDVIVAGSSIAKETFNNFIKLLPVTSVFALL